MRQAIILREVGKVVLTETKVTTLTLEMTDKKGNWLASDANGKFYSNDPEAIVEALHKDADGCNDWTAFCMANGYLRLIKDKGIVKA
jgi:hypothetical protein